MQAKVHQSVAIDADAVSPDSLKAAFGFAVDELFKKASGMGLALNWNSLESAMHRGQRAEDAVLTLRATVAP